jgi:hypothetical protein
VIVLDVKHAPEQSSSEHVKDIERLKNLVKTEAPHDVALRLFLVEDVTAPVIELLGSAYGCYPSFFEEHMYTIGNRRETCMDENGRPISAASSSSYHQGKNRSLTETGNLPFFSLPFRRMFEYKNVKEKVIHGKRRTMFRNYNEDGNLLEERVSGVLHATTVDNFHIGTADAFISFEIR